MSHFIRFIRRRFQVSISTTKDSTPLILFCLQQNPTCLRPLSTIPTPAETPTPTSSFTLSYLINSCGLSRQSAISVSQKIQLKSVETPDSVLTCLRNNGFTETQIRNIIVKWPRSLLAKPEKTLLPKFQYFQDLGIPVQMLAKAFSSGPKLLTRSLHKQIIPYVDFIKTYLQSNEDTIVSINRMTRFFLSDFRKVMESNIKILQEHDVPEFLISRLMVQQPTALMSTSARFNEVVSMVKHLGFDTSTKNFILAIRVVSSVSRSNLEEKINGFQSLGWSQEEILSAFKLQPALMWISQKKIKRVMSFFVNEMDLKPSDLARRPGFLMLSLEKRIIPRCSVMQILLSKGIVKKDSSLGEALRINDKAFVERFLVKYQEDIPEILTMYQGKMRNSKSEESTTLKL